MLGIRDTNCQNKSLFTKLVWRLLDKLDSVWALTRKSLYFPKSNLLKAKTNYKSSKLWKNVVIVKNDTLHLGCWELGDPRSIRIWEDPWIPSLHFKKPFGPRHMNPNLNWVSDLRFLNSMEWNISIILTFFSLEIANEITKIKLPNTRTHNKIIWTAENNGSFTVKSAYRYFSSTVRN